MKFSLNSFNNFFQLQDEPKMVNSLEPSFFLHQLLRHLSILAGVLQREIANSMSHSLYTESCFRRELFESLSVTNQRKWFDCCSKMVVGLGWFSNYFDGFVTMSYRAVRSVPRGWFNTDITSFDDPEGKINLNPKIWKIMVGQFDISLINQSILHLITLMGICLEKNVQN